MSEAAPDAGSPNFQDGVLAREPAPPPYLADVAWGVSDETSTLEMGMDEFLPLEVAVDVEAVVRLELRADVDGAIHELSFGPEPLGLSTPWVPLVRAADLSIDETLEFSAMIEGKLHVTRDGHTRVMPLPPVFVHPTEPGGLLLYGEEAHEAVFAGGDYRGILPIAVVDGEEPEPVAHVSVARVRVLPAGEAPSPE